MLLALAEPHATALLLAVFGVLMAFSVLFTRALDRVGVPVVLLFLLLGMIGGSEGIGGVAFADYEVAFRLGTIALILILFDGGLNTSMAAVRRSAGPAGVLATVGVAGTAALLAVIARLFGLGWTESLLIGAIVSSTDAAAVFAVLRGGNLRVKDPVRSTLEVESCINDPMAVLLTVVLVDLIKSGNGFAWTSLLEVPIQLVVGGVVGVVVGWATGKLLSLVPFSTTGLYPVVTLASAFIAFGAGTLAHGSGFLAVFVAAVVLGNGQLHYRAGLVRVHDALGWLSQVSMFLMLGLLAFPSKLVPVAGIGLALGLALAFVARPLVVTLCLLPFGWPAKHIAYTSWVGLRGAVPIILAIFPVMEQLPGGQTVFNIVFFIVVVSALVPGASIVPLTRYLKLDEAEAPTPAAALEMHSLRKMNGEIKVYLIDETVAVCGATLAEIDFPEGASAILLVRGTELHAARGKTRLEPGDHVYIFCKPADEPIIGLLFGRSVEA